jgi:hypothetical protein
MNIGTGVRIASPKTKIRWHEKSARMGIVQHDKGDDDIKGTIEVIATFVYARSPRPGPPSTQPIAAQLRCKVTACGKRGADVRLHFAPASMGTAN